MIRYQGSMIWNGQIKKEKMFSVIQRVHTNIFGILQILYNVLQAWQKCTDLKLLKSECNQFMFCKCCLFHPSTTNTQCKHTWPMPRLPEGFRERQWKLKVGFGGGKWIGKVEGRMGNKVSKLAPLPMYQSSSLVGWDSAAWMGVWNVSTITFVPTITTTTPLICIPQTHPHPGPLYLIMRPPTFCWPKLRPSSSLLAFGSNQHLLVHRLIA
jgi:hypothetical protein